MNQASPDHDLITTLAQRSGDAPCISLYLPTSPRPDEAHENDIRIKNLTRSAEEQMKELGLDSRTVTAFRERISGVWSELVGQRTLRRGAGLFVDGEQARGVILNYAVEEIAIVSECFHVKPLFRDAKASACFDVLALSEKEVRLFRGDGVALQPIELGADVPQSLTDVAGNQPAGRHLDHHAGDRGSEQAIFHGHGAGKDDTDTELERFLRELDRALREFWQVGERPMVLAGVERLLTAYRSVSGAPKLAEEEVHGNVEHLSAGELHELTWPIIDRQLEEHKRSLLEELDGSGPNTPVARKVADVVRAAAEGRVDTVFVASDARCWGDLADGQFEIERHEKFTPGDRDLLDVAAVESHLHGGTVYMLSRDEIPGKGLTIARLRY